MLEAGRMRMNLGNVVYQRQFWKLTSLGVRQHLCIGAEPVYIPA